MLRAARCPLRAALWAGLLSLCLLAPASGSASFVAFESGHVRPLALSPDGSQLYAVNTADNRLEVFEVGDGALLHVASVAVGLEPVAVAVRSNGEVWVVNHLSDSVSIVDPSVFPPRVKRTLLVGDEPHDLVFAGPGGNRAFISTARRGQNDPDNPMLTTEGEGRARVWVFDATALGTPAGGTPIAKLNLFGDTPRPLATNASGSRVYVGVFHSGNQTTAVGGPAVDVFIASDPNYALEPNTNFAGNPAPPVGRVVKFNNGTSQWLDDRGNNFNGGVAFSLPDLDVFALDANAGTPAQTASFAHVGTILFNMIANPVSGKLYVSNGDARNEVRFEGPGTYVASLGGFPSPFTVRGHLHEYHITVIDPNAPSVTPRHLNKHIDYSLTPAAAEAAGFKTDSLATPLGMAIRSDGSTLYVAAFGSSKVGVFDTAALEGNTFTPDDANHIDITGGGPSAVVLDEARDQLYVMARFQNQISVVDVTSAPGAEVAVVSLPHNPEPTNVRDGRPFLYDATLTSANGEASCSSCHIFSNMDDLAWDLGNPDGTTLFNTNVQAIPLLNLDTLLLILNFAGILPDGFVLEHHPMKGPMLSQALIGLANHGPMHWRGDRSGGVPPLRNDPESLNEDAAFKKFNVAFEGLLGRTGPLTTPQMQAFTDFILQVSYLPNPIRNLDNSLTTNTANFLSANQTNGENLFRNIDTDGAVGTANAFTCNDCHGTDAAAGFFGTDGDSSFDGEAQIFKVPHLRNAYQRIGMFGVPGQTFLGDQVRGAGFLHDGFVDTLFTFVSAAAFTFPGTPAQQLQGRRDVEAFILAFDSNVTPAVGQQVTQDTAGSNAALLPVGSETVDSRTLLLLNQDLVTTPRPSCDVVAKGVKDGEARGWIFDGPGNLFLSDRAGEAGISLNTLRAQANTPGQALTFMCVPPGNGDRIGIDRDENLVRDGNECGDLDGDGVHAPNDRELLRLALAGLHPASETVPRKCSIVGAADAGDSDGDGLLNECTIQDLVVMQLIGIKGPGKAQVCSAASL